MAQDVVRSARHCTAAPIVTAANSRVRKVILVSTGGPRPISVGTNPSLGRFVSARPHWPLVIGLSAAVAAAAVYADIDAAGRAIVVLWFMLVCPGMAIVRLLRLSDPLTEFAIAVALSLAIETVLAVALLYAGSANFEVTFGVLLVVTLAAVAVDVTRGFAGQDAAPQRS
jgi:hypothetical protein